MCKFEFCAEYTCQAERVVIGPGALPGTIPPMTHLIQSSLGQEPNGSGTLLSNEKQETVELHTSKDILRSDIHIRLCHCLSDLVELQSILSPEEVLSIKQLNTVRSLVDKALLNMENLATKVPVRTSKTSSTSSTMEPKKLKYGKVISPQPVDIIEVSPHIETSELFIPATPEGSLKRRGSSGIPDLQDPGKRPKPSTMQREHTVHNLSTSRVHPMDRTHGLTESQVNTEY